MRAKHVQIDELLRSSDKKLLVLIDDIDRLAPEEICNLFRIIKAIGNFPNVIYLLAFDIDIVSKSLETALIPQGSAQNYLEKIVQVPFALPTPDKIALRNLLFGKLNEIVRGKDEELFDTVYWTNIYFDGIDHFIATPRDVIRLTNVLQATYPCLKGEVNPVDFIAIEAMRIFMSELYDEIRSNQIILTGVGQRSTEMVTNEKKKHIFETWLELLPEEDRVSAKNLLSRIFPAFGSAFGGVIYGSNWNSNWRKELRVCSSDCFHIYFRFSLGADIISNAEIKALLRVAGDKNAFEDILLEYASQTRSDGSSRVRAILERMEDYTKEGISDKDIQSVISTFFYIGDKLLLQNDEPHGMFGFGNEIQISRLIYQLLNRVKEAERFNIINSAIRECQAISLAVHEVIVWGQEHGKFGSTEKHNDYECTFSADNLKLIESNILDKINRYAETECLLSVPVPHLSGILYAWGVWAGTNDPVREWVDRIIKTDKGLISLLPHFGSIRRGQSMGDLAIRKKYRLDPRSLEPYIDPNKIAERLEKIDASGLDMEQGKAVRQFLHEHTLMKMGKNPDTEPWDD
jgi:predicted KAP-like P-loop ATPase